jgi:hypothetical protein
VRSLCKFAVFVGTAPVEIFTDHKSLENWFTESIMIPSGPSGRRARWHECLSRFDITVVYIRGENNEAADCLSRWAYPASEAGDDSIHGTEQDAAAAGGEAGLPLCAASLVSGFPGPGAAQRAKRVLHCGDCFCEQCCSSDVPTRSRRPCVCRGEGPRELKMTPPPTPGRPAPTGIKVW